MILEGYDTVAYPTNTTPRSDVVLLEKVYSLSKAQKWLRSPSDDQGWFTLTHSKSGNFLSATSLAETIFEGKYLFTVLPRKKDTNMNMH